jgi:cell division transport system permease protein
MNIISAFLQRHWLACLESWQRIIAKPLTSGLTIVALGITIMLCSLVWAAWQNVNTAQQHWQQNISVALFLKPTISVEQAQALAQQLTQQSQLVNTKLILPNEALQTLDQQKTWQDVLQALPENPLPAVIETKLSSQLLSQPQLLEQTVTALQQLPEVETIQFDLDKVTHTLQLFTFTKQLLIGGGILLGLTAIIISLQSLHLLLSYSWRELNLRLSMGATRKNVALPLIYMGIWCGLIAALIAVGGAVYAVDLSKGILSNIFGSDIAVSKFSKDDLISPLFISAAFCGLVVKLACIKQLQHSKLSRK